jgi:Membrane carboxypeptidase/penicillin-binding protein
MLRRLFRDFMKMALASKPDIPFRAPPGIKLIWVSAKTGIRTSASSQGAIQEAFKPGTAPPDSYAAAMRRRGRKRSIKTPIVWSEPGPAGCIRPRLDWTAASPGSNPFGAYAFCRGWLHGRHRLTFQGEVAPEASSLAEHKLLFRAGNILQPDSRLVTPKHVRR